METKQTFTPGPWIGKGTAGHDKHGQSVVYAESDGHSICIVYDGEANASLIASSPDLLVALEFAHRELESLAWRVSEKQPSLLHEDTQAAIDQAYAAISEARGQV